MSDYLDFGTPISFGWTAQYLDHKTATRREWKDSHAAKFYNAFDRAVIAGHQLRVPAIDKGYSAGGKQIGWCIFTRRPFKERLADMGGYDLCAEGVPCDSVEEFVSKYFKGDETLEVWVISFRFVPLPEEEECSETNQEEPALPWMPLNAIPAPDPRLKVFGSAKTDEHNTPEFITDAARAIMGGIDLDPMSNAIANRTIRAHQIYTKQDDGLQREWLGRIWLNPPFSLADRAVGKLITDYESGDIFEAILLIKSAPDTKRHQSLYRYPFCDLNGRLKFEAEGNKQSAPFATVLFYLGPNFPRFRQIMSAHGRVHLGQRLTEELECDRLRLQNEVAILKGKPELINLSEILKHCEKCNGRGCDKCDLGWSHATDWDELVRLSEISFDYRRGEGSTYDNHL